MLTIELPVSVSSNCTAFPSAYVVATPLVDQFAVALMSHVPLTLPRHASGVGTYVPPAPTVTVTLLGNTVKNTFV